MFNPPPPIHPPSSHTNAHYAALDMKHIWHPCTQMHDHIHIPLIPIASAKGIYLYDMEGRAYMDCISSWWVNLFGHGNAIINAAIHAQLESLEHTLLAGFSHEPIITLSRTLCSLLPNTLTKCFYADNGSSAIEIALKMSYHYHYNTAAPSKRTRFLSLTNAYHGETIGALNISDVGLYKTTYMPLLSSHHLITKTPNVFTANATSTHNCTSHATLHAQSSTKTHTVLDAFKDANALFTPAQCNNIAYYQQELYALESILERYGDEICAFILEPIIQCAGGMHIYPVGFIKHACELCKKYGILIIFDEIAVGFGRTGTMFALEQCGVVPDMLCLSKGISGGYLPLSVVITSDVIYEAFYAPYEANRAFLHSHSYTGNALACAAANATLQIFSTQNIIQNNHTLSQHIATKWLELAALPMVKHVRYCGMVFALDIEITKTNLTKRAGLSVFQQALQKGLLLRPLGDTIYFMPPYIITLEEAYYAIQCLQDILLSFYNPRI